MSQAVGSVSGSEQQATPSPNKWKQVGILSSVLSFVLTVALFVVLTDWWKVSKMVTDLTQITQEQGAMIASQRIQIDSQRTQIDQFSAQAEAARRVARTMPIKMSYREASLGNPGLVLQLRNQSDRHLEVVVVHTKPTTNSTKRIRTGIAPGALRELGWAEDMPLYSGEVIELQHADYDSVTVKVP